MKKAPSVEVMPDVPNENSPEFKKLAKQHKKYTKPAMVRKDGGVVKG